MCSNYLIILNRHSFLCIHYNLLVGLLKIRHLLVDFTELPSGVFSTFFFPCRHILNNSNKTSALWKWTQFGGSIIAWGLLEKTFCVFMEIFGWHCYYVVCRSITDFYGYTHCLTIYDGYSLLLISLTLWFVFYYSCVDAIC